MVIFKKIIIIFLLSISIISAVYADEDKKSLYEILSNPLDKVSASLSGVVGSRYFEDSATGSKVLQNAVILRFAVDFDGKLQLISDAMSGGKYRGARNVYYTIDGDKVPKQEIYIRRLFARTRIGEDISVELGALDPSDDRKSLVGLSQRGWVDGGRVIYQTESGEKIEITAGKLSGVTEINALERGIFDFDSESAVDFIEVKISGKLFDAISYQAGVENFDHELYGKIISKSDIELTAGHLVKLIAEGMVNFESGGHKMRVGFETEIMKAFSENQSGIIFYADYLNTSEDFGLHNHYVALDGQGTGEKVRVGLKTVVSKKKKISVYASLLQDINTGEHQIRTGFTVKFRMMKKRKQ